MGTKYKRWYPLLRNGAGLHNFTPHRIPTTLDYREANNPDREPSLAYPVEMAPASVFAPVYPRSIGLTGAFNFLTNTGETVHPVDPSSVFAVRNTLLRLPQTVLVVNGCQFDGGPFPGIDECDRWLFPVLPNNAVHHAIGLAGSLSDALVPRGVSVYEVYFQGEGTTNWLMESVPVSPPDGWIGGDVYCIVLTNDSAYKAGHQYLNLYTRNIHGSICDYDDTFTGTSYFIPGRPDLSANYPGFGVSPLVAWVAGVRHLRNFHGLACAVPWEGNSAAHSPSGTIADGGTAISYRLDLDNVDNRATMQANVAELNAASPHVPGDATWEYADVAVDQDYGFFLDKVKTWFGL